MKYVKSCFDIVWSGWGVNDHYLFSEPELSRALFALRDFSIAICIGLNHVKSKIQNIYHTSKIPFLIDDIIFVIRLRIIPTLQLYHYALLLVCSVEVKKYVIWLIFSWYCKTKNTTRTSTVTVLRRFQSNPQLPMPLENLQYSSLFFARVVQICLFRIIKKEKIEVKEKINDDAKMAAKE